jgi:hypothetical protein
MGSYETRFINNELNLMTNKLKRDCSSDGHPHCLAEDSLTFCGRPQSCRYQPAVAKGKMDPPYRIGHSKKGMGKHHRSLALLSEAVKKFCKPKE